ncbi:unnamed protein product, partial [marine sediment metagenome]
GFATMKVFYICGPYRAATEHGVVENIRRAEAVAIQVWQAGYVALCPHMNTRLFGGLCPDDTWLQGDLELLRRCDGVVLVLGWEASMGACGEIKEADRLKIPIYNTVDEIKGVVMRCPGAAGKGARRVVEMKRLKKKKKKKPALSKLSSKCPNCGRAGPHFVPPSCGDKGFFICDSLARCPRCGRASHDGNCGGDKSV